MPTSLRYLSVSIATAIITGCSSTADQQSDNPFAEPAQVKPVARSQQAAPAALATAAMQPVAIPIPTQIGPKLQTKTSTVPAATQTPPHIQEMLTEAARLGSLQDYLGQAELLNQIGFMGHPDAFYRLGRMYMDGSLPNDMSQVVRFVSLAHDGGHTEATRVLGMLYLRGEGVPKDTAYGHMLLESAAVTNMRAAKEYGMLLLNLAPPALNDPEKGLKFLELAAAGGDAGARDLLPSQLAKHGREVTDVIDSPQPAPVVDPAYGSRAASPEEKAISQAQSGNTDGMLQYAQHVLINRIKVPEREFTAYCWLKAASELGNMNAYNELRFIAGVQVSSDKTSPGRIDQCVLDLKVKIEGHY